MAGGFITTLEVRPGQPTPAGATKTQETTIVKKHPYVGMWITADGYIRHELLPDGRWRVH